MSKDTDWTNDPEIPTPLVVTTIKKTCRACPSQWEGKTKDARTVYVRYRWGCLLVCVSPVDGDVNDAVTGNEIYCHSIGDGLHGILYYDDLQKHTAGKIVWPEEEEGGTEIDDESL